VNSTHLPKNLLAADFAESDFIEELPTLIDAHQSMSLLDDYSEVSQG
jgi:hypothetical protein